jgi:hypothetical protein
MGCGGEAQVLVAGPDHPTDHQNDPLTIGARLSSARQPYRADSRSAWSQAMCLGLRVAVSASAGVVSRCEICRRRALLRLIYQATKLYRLSCGGFMPVLGSDNDPGGRRLVRRRRAVTRTSDLITRRVPGRGRLRAIASVGDPTVDSGTSGGAVVCCPYHPAGGATRAVGSARQQLGGQCRRLAESRLRRSK